MTRLSLVVAVAALVSVGRGETISGPQLQVHLPFPPGIAYGVICGPGDAPYHTSARSRHAFDFDMLYGSEVSAAASGRVVRTEARFEASTGRPEHNNYIAIEHPGGIVSEYHHLMQEGVLVRPGEWVERGEVIGFSGASGMAVGAHLHFVLLRGEVSVPVSFVGWESPPPKGSRCVSRNVPEGLQGRYRDLATALQLAALLRERGLADLAAALAHEVLESRVGPAPDDPAGRRAVLALAPLEARLERMAKGNSPDRASRHDPKEIAGGTYETTGE